MSNNESNTTLDLFGSLDLGNVLWLDVTYA